MQVRFFSCLLSTLLIVGNVFSKEIISDPSSVTVFLDGAEIKHSEVLALQKGKNTLVFTELSGDISSNTIQVSLSGEVKILSVQYSLEVNEHQKRRVKLYEDSVGAIVKDLKIQKLKLSNFQKEESLLKANENRIGVGESVSLATLEEAANFYRKRHAEISKGMIELEFLLTDLEKERIRLSEELNKEHQKLQKKDGHITVEVFSKLATSSDCKISYLVNNASWTPIYNIRSESSSSPVNIELTAQILNLTGADWEDVEVTLSTNNSSVGLEMPMMYPWLLDFNVYRTFKSNLKLEEAEYAIEEKSVLRSAPAMVYDSYVAPVAVSTNEIAVSYKLAGKQTFISTEKSQTVEVVTNSLDAFYSYTTIPKLDDDAFLQASLVNWEQLNLMEARANIYFQGTYVGETYINPSIGEDTMKISMGRDPKILVQRVNLSEFESKKMIGTNKKEKFGFEISIKNLNIKEIQIDIEDQIPVSQNKEIIVEVEEISGATQDGVSGKLNWHTTLQPNEVKRYNIIFSVKYPRNSTVNINSKKGLAAPARFW